MATPPPGTAKTEPKRYLGMALGALALSILTVALFVPVYNWLPDAGDAQANLILAALVAFLVALVLALISLVKMRHKVLPILALLAAAIPLFGSLCCVGGVLSFIYGANYLENYQLASAPKPKVEWNTAATAIVAQEAHPLQQQMVSIPGDYARAYIPEARLSGDGRIVWASTEPLGASRRVTEGQLPPEQMTALLQQFVDAGFFGWNDYYWPFPPVENSPFDDLTVNLLAIQRTVNVPIGSNPPKAFGRLLQTLTYMPGVESKDYTPTQGTLLAVPTTEAATSNWDKENLNFDLSTAARGLPVEGKALQLAWEVVNRNPAHPPPVSQNGVAYTLYIDIPGLMYR